MLHNVHLGRIERLPEFRFVEKLHWRVERPFGKFLDLKEFYRGKAWPGLNVANWKFAFHLVVSILENQSTGSSGNVQLKHILVNDGQPWFHIQITYPWGIPEAV